MLSASYSFGAAAQPADDRVRWTSSDSSSFTVDRAGYGHALKYTGTPITVTATASGVSGSTDITVLPKFDTLIVTVSATVAVGRTVRPTLAIHRFDGEFWAYAELPELANRVVLTSSDPGILTVASDGTIHAAAQGRAVITGELLGKKTEVPVNVVPGFPVNSLPGTENYGVKGVNDAGHIIAGRSGASDVLWQDGSATDLGSCLAHDINNAGQIACEVRQASPRPPLPGVYAQGTITVLVDSAVYWSGASTGINESGTVVGKVSIWTGSPRLFLAISAGVTVPAFVAATPGDGLWYGEVYAINSFNHVVATLQQYYVHSYIIGGDSTIELVPLGGRWSEVRDLNDADDAIGTSEWMQGGGNATVWRAANKWRPESPSYRASAPVGISEGGLVIGNGADGPYVWRGGRYTILNDVVASSDWKLTKASAISRGGIVAAQATNAAGVKSVVLIDLSSAP